MKNSQLLSQISSSGEDNRNIKLWTATDAQRDFRGFISEVTRNKNKVAISEYGEVTAYLISPEDFEILVTQKKPAI
ncbi:MAG: hypothetical protein JNL01_03280 [Bdellovibrionales bacterium]|nr:hypothetical protein [Bdellovibrionales bacterium]